MDARFLRPLGVGEVIDAAFKIYRARFGALLRAVAVVVIPVQILNVIVVLSLPSQETVTRTSNGFTTTTTNNSGAAIAALVLVQVVSVLSIFLAQAVCLKIVTDAYLGTVTGWRESLKFGISKLRSLLWIAVLVMLGVGLGLVFCVLPGVWLYVSWAVAIPVLLVEQTKGTKALSRSFGLVRSRWWPTFGTLLIAAIITGIVSFALTLITVPVLLSGASESATQVANAITTGIASVLTTPISAAVAALIYFDLRVRKEGFDVALMAQRVGIDPPPGGFPTAPNQWGSPPPATWGAPDQPWGTPPPATGWSPPPPQMPPPGMAPPPGTPPPPPGALPPPPTTPPAPPGTPPAVAPWNTPPASTPPPPAPPWPSGTSDAPPPPPPADQDEPPADPSRDA